MKITSPSIAKNFPDFIREEYPLFVKLVERYYDFLDTTYAGDVTSIKDIDNVPTEFIQYYRKQYAVDIKVFDNLDFKQFLYFAKDFYTSRGTEDSIKFLFRALFAEDITIDYPGKNILRASDGKWFQEFHIELLTKFGAIAVGVDLTFSNAHGNYVITPSRVSAIPGTNRQLVFFQLPNKINIDVAQQFTQRDSGGAVTFVGEIQLTSAKISIAKPGKYWQAGQVIRIPGTSKDTIARASRVDSSGGLLEVEVLEYGYDHEPSQALIVSPYPNKPFGSVIDINSTITSASPLTYNYTISIQDFTDGSTESIQATSSKQDYFLTSNYFSDVYFGSTVISKSELTSATNAAGESPISIVQWLESRATLVFQDSYLVRDRGYYLDTDSLVSNQDIRLQDNFYYQVFSYVIQTEKELSLYEQPIQTIHPAGMKYFGSLTKTAQVVIPPQVMILFGSDNITRLDVTLVSDAVVNYFTKNLTDSVTNSDTNTKKFTKSLADATTNNEVLNKLFNKALIDSTSITDAVPLSLTKSLFDSFNTIDSTAKYVTRQLSSDSVTTSDGINSIQTAKALSDSVTMQDGTPQTPVASGYFAAPNDYYVSSYFYNSITMGIS